MLETVWAGSGTLLYIARPVLGRSAKKDRSATGAVDRCGHASVHRERYTRRNLDGEQELCKSQQPVGERYNYDSNKPNNYISYLMTQITFTVGPCVNHFQRVILHGTLCCLTEKQILPKKEEAKRGLILEVDLVYPAEHHKTHNGYPLAPEKKNRERMVV